MHISHLVVQAQEHADYVREIREALHAAPEPSLEEYETSRLVSRELASFGCTDVQTGIVQTGVMASIHGVQSGPVIMLRVDMDAMSGMDDACGAHYASRRKGVCHCCGHDVHTALGLGTAKILMQNRHMLKGTAKIFFQPAEEKPFPDSRQQDYSCYTEPPVGKRSAFLAREAGILENPKVDRLLGIHCWPLLEAGKIGYAYGSAMAGTGNFHISILGKAGHAGMPHKTVDALVLACETVSGLQTLISRKRNPSIPAVLNIGTIQGGTRRSVVCGQVDMAGTLRCSDPDFLAEQFPAMMEERIAHICRSMGGDYVLDYGVDQPPVMNDTGFTAYCAGVLAKTLGQQAVELRECPMTAEDFSFLSQEVPALYLKLGTCGGEKSAYPLHNPYFDVDPACYCAGLLGICSIMMDYLGGLEYEEE